ncbi:MAG TPA: ATP-binding protein [Xanthobacteraceae bacterium]|jgi:hypothetical protein
MPQPPDLTGGGGFTFEDAAVALFLAALLGEQSAPGIEPRIVSRVAVQQRNRGEPLDDLMVDGVAADDSMARLSLQVKRAPAVTAGDADFKSVVKESWETLTKQDFREDVDRVGVVAGTIDDNRLRDVADIGGWARGSPTLQDFLARFQPGEAGQSRRAALDTFRTILAEEVGSENAAAAAYRLLRHFVLLRFDLIREGAADQTNAIERLRPVLHDAARAHDVWNRLRILAREGAGAAWIFDRKALVAALRGGFRLAGATSLQRDLACIREETNNALATIPADIDGVAIARESVLDEIRSSMRSNRIVHIVGLPGTGKSAVLRELIESVLPNGTTLLLKSDRLLGRNWAAHARALGVERAALEGLLTEISATGNAILFVDGIDRIELAHRGVVLDLINTILNSPLLAEWKIVATARDNGIEPLRTWLPPALLQGGGVGTVVVGPFGNDEATALAQSKSALRPLLFGNERVREIARRPFFAAVLARSLAGAVGEDAPPQSEIELIRAWWARGGGHDADQSLLYNRQRTLIALAKNGAGALGRRVPMDGLDLTALRELKQDDIVRDVEPGHSLGFAHDIFFEWAFLHLLIERHDAWIEEIQAIGEPPMLGRVVELLSQDGLRDAGRWEAQLGRLEGEGLRPQWARVWLLAPFASPNFWDFSAAYAEAVARDTGQRLAKLAVWFQAEKTRANPLILSGRLDIGELTPRDIIRTADSLAWPSDVSAWSRFCYWAIGNIAGFPARVIPDLLSAFEVWQYMFADVANDVSRRILALTTGWLEDIEDRQHAEEFRYDRGPWEELRRGELEELERRTRSLLLRSARFEEPRIQAYLARVLGRPRLRRDAYASIVAFSPLLAQHHAQALVELTLAELKGPLPDEIAARGDEGDFFPGPQFSHYDWQHLAIEDHGHGFLPPSPSREPFASLFKDSPAEAMALVRDLTNHAITAWRQLFQFDRHRGGATPRPLVLRFPWGAQEFWGTNQTYMWSRGQWGAYPVACGLMALEHWALGEVEGGRAVDEVFEDILRGHESCAVLAIVVLLALNTRRLSAVTLPLATSQMLWHWDIARSISDRSPTNLMGFIRPSDMPHARAVQTANGRAERRLEVRWLASLFVIAGEEPLREAAQAAIKAFPENLPLTFDEEANNSDRIKELRRTAEIWSEVGELELYATRPAPDGSGVLIELQGPSAAAPDVVAVRERQARMNNQLELLLWTDRSLGSRSISETLALSDAVDRARRLNHIDLFDIAYDTATLDSMDQGAVAGVAAVALCYGGELDAETLAWAQDVTERAARTPERRDGSWFAGSKLIHHPCLYAVTGVDGLLRRGVAGPVWRRVLLELGGHPLEEVSENAIGRALALWETDPRLAWAGLNLGIRISTASHDALPQVHGYDHATEPDRVAAAVAASLAEIDAGEPRTALEPVPEAWVFAPVPERDGWPHRRGHEQPVWREPDIFLRWDFLPKILARIPIAAAMGDALRRPAFIGFCVALLGWTNERLSPSWRDDNEERRERRTSDLMEWRSRLLGFLAQVALQMEPDEADRRLVQPILGHTDDEIADSLIHPFVDGLVACGIMDAPQIDLNALRYVEACRDRLLRDRAWERARWDDGQISGFDLPEIVRVLFLIGVAHAPAAARFANGDWSEIGRMLPLIDPLVRAAGDVPAVMGSFLTLCERSMEHYAADAFVEQVSVALDRQEGIPLGWRDTTIPARIAALVHGFAEKASPLRPELAATMLRILDRLVDMGDRRSAALQTSEVFKEVRFPSGRMG